MAAHSENESKHKGKATRRERRRAERQRPSKPELTGRIRTRSKKPEADSVSSETSQEKPTVHRASPVVRKKRPRGEPKEGRGYQPLIYAKNGKRIEDLEHEIGYGKTPEKGKFEPGQSGNPKGRPKGSKGLKTILNDALGQKIVSRANGKEKKITTREGIIMRLVKKALDGDHNAIKLIMARDEDFELRTLAEDGAQSTDENSSEIDDEILKEFERQILESVSNYETSEDDESEEEYPGDEEDANDDS